MTWPIVAVNTTNTDSDTDDLTLARLDILDLQQKFNQVIAHVSTYMRTVLDDADAAAARATLIAMQEVLTTRGDLVHRDAANATARLARGAANQLLISNATDVVWAAFSDALHGTRGGGTQHANAVAAGEAGFLTGADKTKLDGVKTLAKDHGGKAAPYTLQLDEADLHLVAFTAATTLTIASTLATDRATVVVKNGGFAITLAGIDDDAPTLTVAVSTQDRLAIIKSFGRIAVVGQVLNRPTV